MMYSKYMHLPSVKINFRGFTLMELMITVSIIAVLAAVGATTYSQSQKLARDSRRKSDLRSIAVALELYYQKNKRYPCNSAPGTYQYSYNTTSNWITDNCSPSVALNPTYINQVPVDPLNNGNQVMTGVNYSYGYYSELQVNCTRGQNYILFALLENKNDPDNYGNKQNTPCGGWSASSYIFVLSN